MQPESVGDAILAALADETGRAVPHLVDVIPLVINHGIEHDSDAVFVTMVLDGQLNCGVVVGCSLLVGTAVREFLEQYCHHDAQQIIETLDGWIADAEDAVADDSTCFCPVRGEDSRWRSFRGERLKNYVEILALTKRDLN